MTQPAQSGRSGPRVEIADPSLTPPPSMMARRKVLVIAAGLLLAVGVGGGIGATVAYATHHDGPTNTGAVSPPSRSYTFVVPPGTAAKQAQGVKVAIMPAVLHMKVGDHLVIHNHDVRLVTVGPYAVGAGQTIDQVMQFPSVVQGYCSLQPNGRLRIIVTA